MKINLKLLSLIAEINPHMTLKELYEALKKEGM